MKVNVDFEVFKALTVLRNSEDETENDVLRKLLNLRPLDNVPLDHEKNNGWHAKGVTFPNGTEFRAKRKGRLYYGKVENGVLVMNGKSYKSPSSAAVDIAGHAVNGWRFWECKIPNEGTWRLIDTLRK